MTIREWLEQHPEVDRTRVEVESNYGDSLWWLTDDDLDEKVIYAYIYDDGSAMILI